MLRYVLIASLLAFDVLPNDSQIRELLAKISAHQADLNKLRENYGYIERFVEESGKKVKTETYEVTFFKDRRVRRLTERDGKPLAGAALEKENRRVERLVTQLDKGTAPPLDNRRLRIQDLLAACQFTNGRFDKFQSRDVVACEFHPRPGARLHNANERFVYGSDGALIIDPDALQIPRSEFTLREAFKVGGGLLFAMKPGTHFVDEDVWNADGIWLPKSTEFRMTARATGAKIDIRRVTSFSDYHRFNVAAQQVK